MPTYLKSIMLLEIIYKIVMQCMCKMMHEIWIRVSYEYWGESDTLLHVDFKEHGQSVSTSCFSHA